MMEYSVMFVVILLVIVYAAITFVKPSLGNVYNQTSRVLDTASNIIANAF